MTQSAMWENKLLLEWRGEIINAHKPQSISFLSPATLKTPEADKKRRTKSEFFIVPSNVISGKSKTHSFPHVRAIDMQTLPLLCLQEVRGVQLNEGLGQLQKFTFLELEIGGGWWTSPDVNAG